MFGKKRKKRIYSETLRRVGNFEISRESGKEHDFIRIGTADGNWAVRHRDDSHMYSFYSAACADPDTDDYLQLRIVMEYRMSGMMLDAEFVRDWMEAVDRKDRRDAGNAPETDEKEDATALEEAAMMEDMKKTADDGGGE